MLQRRRYSQQLRTGTWSSKSVTSGSKDALSPAAGVYCKTVEANRKTLLKGRSWMEGEGNVPVTYELEEASVRDTKIIRGRELGKKTREKGCGK